MKRPGRPSRTGTTGWRWDTGSVARPCGRSPMLPPLIAVACLLGPTPPADPDQPNGLRAVDIFGRTLDEHGLILLDWEGYIANPAIKVVIVPPPDARYPARLIVRARE